MLDPRLENTEKAAQALFRHLEDVHGFRGLRLEVVSPSGETTGYRVLPAPFGEAGASDPADGRGPRLRLIPLGPGGRPLPSGARRLPAGEARSLILDTLARAAQGWALSATRTSGLEVSFGPKGLKVSFGGPQAIAPRIPVDEPCAPPVLAPLTRSERDWAASADLASPDADILPPTEAGHLLRALGLVGPNGQVRRDDRRKYNQIVYFLRLLEGLASRLPAGRELLVVDCGCGKSRLLFVIAYWLVERLRRRAYFVGLDAAPEAVEASRRIQAALGYRNMEFVVSSIAGWTPPSPTDLVLSLHACDTATDEAIALGIGTGAAGIVAVPCCQHELAGQVRQEKLDPLLGRHPILLNRLGDWLTDGLRALALESFGYAVDVLEYVSPLDTPKNIMIRAEKARRPESQAYEYYRAVRDFFGVRPALDSLLSGLWPGSAERS